MVVQTVDNGRQLRYDLGAVLIKRGFFLLAACVSAYGHDIITTKVTFDREIVRLFNTHCISCHREGGMAFSLATWKEARPGRRRSARKCSSGACLPGGP